MKDLKQKIITAKRLENIAVYYLSRYDSSSAHLRQVLERRVQKELAKGATPAADFEAGAAIEDIIAHMKALGYLDDERYAENLARKLRQAGKSASFAKGKMQALGVLGSSAARSFMGEYDEDEAALLFAKKKRLGLDPEKYTKDLGKLARAGFSYDSSEKALERIKTQQEG